MKLSPKSLTQFLSSSISALVIGTILIMSSFWIADIIRYSEEKINRISTDLISARKVILRNETRNILDQISYLEQRGEQKLQIQIKGKVDQAHDIALHIYKQNSGNHSNAEIKKIIKEALRPIRFNAGRGYIFITDLNGKEILYPVAPQFENQNIYNLQDLKGNYVIREEINIVQNQGEGFLTDYWRKPGASNSSMIYPKTSFVKIFEPFNWYIGAGEYLDEVQKDIQKEFLEQIPAVNIPYSGKIIITDRSGNILADNIKLMDIGNISQIKSISDTSLTEYINKHLNNNIDDFFILPLAIDAGGNTLFHAKYFSGWGWSIITSISLEDMKYIAQKEKDEHTRIMKISLGKIGFIILLLLILTFLLTDFFSRKLARALSQLTSFFHNADLNNIQIDENKSVFKELTPITRSANHMVERHLKNMNNLETKNMLLGGIEKSQKILYKTYPTDYQNAIEILCESTSIEACFLYRNQLLPESKTISAVCFAAFIADKSKDVLQSFTYDTLAENSLFKHLINGNSKIYGVNDASDEVIHILESMGLKSIIAIPLVIDNGLWGIFIAGFEKSGKISIDIASTLTTFTESVAQTIINSQIRKNLKESEERFNLAVQGTNDGLWDWDIPGQKIFVSKQCATILGYPSDTTIIEFSEWTSLIHPGDFHNFDQVFKSFSASEDTLLEMDLHIRHRSGKYLLLKLKAKAVRESNNRLTRLVGFITDKTE